MSGLKLSAWYRTSGAPKLSVKHGVWSSSFEELLACVADVDDDVLLFRCDCFSGFSGLSRANPKSTIFILASGVLSEKRMFSGLRSLWTMFWLCMYWMAEMRDFMMELASCSLNWQQLRMRSKSSPPVRSSMMM